MNFDLAQTPMLHAVVTADERLLTDDLQQRAAEAIAQAEQQPEATEAAEAQKAANERFLRLQTAERGLSQHAKDSRDLAMGISRATIEGIIESAAGGKKLEFRKVDELVKLDHQQRCVNLAIQQLVESQIPLARITGLRAESHAMMATARAVERIAQERAERVLGQLREAVAEELVLPVDMSQGVAGALLAHASMLKRAAIQISESADHLEAEFTARHRAGTE
jgi:hypothetical protein